ncbi:MAG: hypothetical protein KME27_28875 [Lyngbya sp. HA4199-MV5]|jgi:hypothetical protein|nr:hypothetical protein [Lyngbya sp. HA4199-MV5]
MKQQGLNGFSPLQLNLSLVSENNALNSDRVDSREKAEFSLKLRYSTKQIRSKHYQRPLFGDKAA